MTRMGRSDLQHIKRDGSPGFRPTKLLPHYSAGFMRTDSRHLSLRPGAHAAFGHLPLAASPRKVPPDMVGAEVVRFVPLKRCTLWRWGCAPKNTRAEANPSTKTELSHKMNEAWKSSPAWGAWEILRPGVFPSESIIARSQPPVSAVSPWDSSVFVPPRHYLPKHRRQRRRRRIAHLEVSRA